MGRFRMSRIASSLAIPRAMNDGKDHDLVRRLVHHIDNDVRRFHEFARSFDKTRPPDIGEAGNCEPIDSGKDAADQLRRRASIALEIQSIISSRSRAAASWTTTFIRRCDG